MSRNFELMTQLENEFGATQDRMRAKAERAAVKPDIPRVAAQSGGEATLRLVQNLFLSATDCELGRVVFCGVDSESGSSSVCANVAKTLVSTSSVSVCVVDANFLSPRLSRLLGSDETVEILRKSSPVHEQCHGTGGNLWLAGRDFLADDHGALPSTTRLKQVFAELKEEFEYVLIDAPGAGVSGDAAVLGQAADGTVLVIEADVTRRIAARKAKEALDAANVRIVGTILNDRSLPIPQWLYRRL